ncbi:MAG: ThuA domain-containing protein [Verrucomicrobia bacterium]|nr:ThuA domain-containing protein [Verrucomicrobiota bacterium]
MKHKLLSLFVVFLATICASAQDTKPLRVFIRAGVKTHGPNQHDHPRFLKEYTQLLTERGVKADGSMEFPTPQQLDNTDVVVVFAADGMKIIGDNRVNFEKFLKRGGGIVVVHDGVVADTEHEWAKKVQGGAWIWPKNAPDKKPTKWLETEVGIYMVDDQHPIVKGLSNFDWKDEIYYDMDMASDAHVIATSFHSVFILAPQLWTYEKTWDGGTAPYRAFVSLPGHEYTSFQTPHYRAVLLRGIAWAGKRANVDEFCSKEELGSLTYPEGGPIAPDKAAAKLNVHPDFNISLVVSEPLVEKVISLDWAPDGKLWVAETPEYPNGRTINKNDVAIAIRSGNHPESFGQTDKENRPARDRISWLEDTNGDGIMDKKHVFADVDHGVPGGLELVTSVVPYKDGVIVAQAPDILWLRDTNGDGVCDKVETLYTGFGNFDTHAVINNFRWGLDGWVYTAVGYSAGQPRSPITGKDFGRITAGILRFKPDGSALEQVASGSCNTWGFDFMPDGEMIYTTATCGEPICHIVMSEKALARGNVGGVRATVPIFDENKIYPAVHHTRPAYVQIDWVGAFTAAAGSCIYNGGAWPEKWNGSHFVSEATMSLLHHEFITPNGVTYKGTKEASRRETEFIAGSDLWFRPIHQRVGPDGALYLVDFYNQAAIHNDTRGPAHGARNAATRPDRDHHFSRIWRIQHKQAKQLTPVAMNKNEPGTLVKLLASENGWQRETAARLLRENGAGGEVETLKNMVKSPNAGLKSHSRIAALYTLAALGQADRDTMGAALRDPDASLRKNILRVAAERDNSDYTPSEDGVRGLLNDPEPRVRLNALIALGTCKLTPEIARVVVETWPKLNDKYLQSAAVGVAAKDPSLFLDAAFGAADPAFLADFVGHVARVAANQQDAAVAARIVTTVAGKSAATDGLKQAVLETLGATLRVNVVPAWSDSLASSFKSLLASARPGVPGAALPLIARWDTAGSLANELKPVITSLGAKLADSSLADDQRGQVAVNLLGVRKLDATIVPNVGNLLGSSASTTLQKRVIEALGATGDPAAAAPLIAAFPKLDPDLREAAFGQVVKRADWSSALVEAMRGNASLLNLLGPANQFRLRTHADKTVAAKANEVIDALKGPEQKQKDELLAKFRPEVEKAGNVENGKKVFLANCAACHKFKNDGADFAPNLTGMGAHGPGELLIHILDPNRLVEPNFVSVSIETKDDQTFDGIVLRENANAVVLRNQSAENEIRKDNIKSRTSTGRSLMPEGFEQLGAEGLRDLLAYICADELRFRILDLAAAFTANTTDGIYNSKESREETLRFKKFGTIKFGDVPFDLISPKKSLTGNNVIVLKGGAGISRGYPQKVEAKVGMAISKLHVLGGIGGWAWPYDGETQKGIPAAKITVHFAGGGTEEFILKNGVEVADYIAKNDVPGSTEVPDLCHNGRQVRYLSRAVKGRGVVEKVSIESFNNIVAPTFVALTVETGDGNQTSTTGGSATPAAKASVNWGPGLKTLLIGGGASHDYNKWFNEADVALLNATGKFSANYIEPQEATAELVRSADALIISANKAFPDQAVREAIFAHANAGKGLVLLHPGLWYNWPDWADYNRLLAGGGSRGHDKFGEFEVTITEPNHLLMKGVPAKFLISDELYYFEPDPAGTPIKVLATASSKAKNKTYPQVFIVEHPRTRIVGLTLGHDGQAHNLAAYQQLLKNALSWVSGK